MTRDKIVENLAIYLANNGKRRIKSLRLEDGSLFEDDARIFAPDGVYGTLEVADGDHGFGVYFEINDITGLTLKDM